MTTEKNAAFHVRLACLRDALDDYGYDVDQHGAGSSEARDARTDLLGEMRNAFTSLLALTREESR